MNTLLKISCSLFICLKVTTGLFSQNYPIIFNEMSGLPSNHIYDCVQDNDGIMWITTDNGVSSYDGYKFTNYGLEDKLTTLFNWELTKDSKGRIWLANRQTPFIYIYNNEFHTISSDFTNLYCSGIHEDSSGNIYYSSINSNKTHKIDTYNIVTEIDSALLGINTKGKKIWLNHQINYPSYYIISRQKMIGDYVVSLCEDQKESNYTLSIHHTLTGIRYELNITSFANELIHFEIFEKNKISLSTDRGFFILNLENKQVTPFLNEFSNHFKNPALVYTDKNSNFWIPDLEVGLVFMKSLPKGVKYTPYNNHQQLVGIDNSNDLDQIQLFFKDGENLLIKEDSLIIINNSEHLLTNRDHKYQVVHARSELIIYDSKNSVNLKPKKVQKINTNQKTLLEESVKYKLIVGDYKCHEWDKNTLYIGANTGLYTLLFKNKTIYVEKLTSGYIYAIKTTDDWIYTGTKNRFIRINKKTKFVEQLDSEHTITQIEYINSRIIAKRINGELLIFTCNNNKLQLKVNNQLLFLNNINTVDNQLWGISSESMYKLQTEDLTIKEEISTIGLSNPHKLNLSEIKNKFYLICNEGYYTFLKKNKYSKREVEYFKIKEVIVNNRKIDSIFTIHLNSNENHVQILLEAHSYPNSNDLIYYYKYNNSSYYSSSSPNIDLLNIPYGKFNIEIHARHKNGKQYGISYLIHIKNPLPFYYSVWFLVLINIILFVIIWFYFKQKQKKRTQMNALKFNLIQNRQKMLTMQMKPHFLSNIFNNLQGSILNDETKKSINLINKVDSFLRNTLLLSNLDIITVSEEIENVKRYISIENGRINKEIELHLPSNWETISQKINVPVFLLQPIIENSIWHGIYKSNQVKGIISITIKETTLYYIISISDNGAGLKSPIKKGNNIALKNIEERLSIIDRYKRTKYIFLTPLEEGTNVKLYVTKKIKSHSHRR